MLTLKRINKEFAELAPEGYTLELERGEGYFYIVLDNGKNTFETHSVMVYRLNALSLECWVGEAEDFLEKVLG